MPIDYKLYPKDWLTKIRPMILKRDKNKCHICGAKNGKPHPETRSKVVLTIAHLTHDPREKDYRFLFALCQRCHLKIDAPVKMLKRKIKSLNKQIEMF